MRSLRGRITLVTVLVAVVAVAVTGLISVGLIRSSTVDEARSQLGAQAAALTRLPDPASALERLPDGGILFAIVEVGTATGDGGAYLDAVLLGRIAAGDPVSATRRGPLGPAMVEGRLADDGAAVVLVRPLSTIDPALGRATARILTALVIGLAVAVAGAFLLAQLLSRQLAATAAAAQRLASGERGVLMPQATTAEVSAVTSALAALDRALSTSEGRQREFLLSISHDLRTPLTAVRGYAEALADGLVDDVPRVGRTLVAETERLDAFVADLLELARMEADDFGIQPGRVDVDALLDEVAAAWAGRAATLGVAVRVIGTGGQLQTDARRLRQVVDGLIENAMRVTPEGGAVEVVAEAGRITVNDDGPGFRPEDLPVALERGVLRERYAGSRPVGTGLGLSIASRLTQRLGATLTVANRPAGGAALSVTFTPAP